MLSILSKEKFFKNIAASTIVKQLNALRIQDIAHRNACQNLPLEGRISHFIYNWEVITKDAWVLNTVQGYEVDLTAQPYQCLPPKELSFNKEEAKALSTEVEKMLSKNAKSLVQGQSPGFTHNYHSSEKGWGSKIDHQPKEAKQLCKTSTFQDGKHHNVERHPKTRGLYDKSRPQRCLLHDTDIKKAQTSNKIQLGRENLSIQLPSFRVVVGPLGLYQDHKATHNHSEIYGSQDDHVHRRYTHYGRVGDSGQGTHSLTDTPPRESGVCDKLPKVATDTNPGNRISGLCNHLKLCGIETARGKNKENTGRDQTTGESNRAQGSCIISTPGETKSRHSGYSTSTPILPQPAELPKGSLGEREPRVLLPNPPVGRLYNRTPMVGDPPYELEWEEPNPTSSYNDHRDGCFNHRLGCGSPRDPNRGTMVKQGKEDAHKLSGTASSNLGNQVFCQGQNQHSDFVESRQHNSNLVHQQTGGTVSPQLNQLTRDLWLWCMDRNITLKAVHLAGKLNVTADKESRVMKDRTDWMLCPKIFHKINQKLGPLQVDLFASRLTTQLPHYASWRPDPEAMACDAFSLDWSQMKGYANPPWNLIGKVLSQVQSQQTSLVIVTPLWKSQPWYPVLLGMTTEIPLLLPEKRDLIQPTHRVNQPDIIPRLVAWTISGKDTETNAFQERLRNSSWHHGDQSHPNHMTHCSQSGQAGVTNGVPIPFLEL